MHIGPQKAVQRDVTGKIRQIFFSGTLPTRLERRD